MAIIEGEGKHFTSGIDLQMMMGLLPMIKTNAMAARVKTCAALCSICKTR